MIRTLIGGVAGGVTMFIVGFLFWASPLARIGYSGASEAQSTAVQSALAANLPHTGRYIVPDPDSPGGTVLYGRGPVATVDYNSAGFSTADPAAMIGTLVLDIVVALGIAFALAGIAGRVTDFPSRARVAIVLTGAAALLLTLAGPLRSHADWRFALYDLVASVAMLAAASLVIARWFVPGGAAAPTVH